MSQIPFSEIFLTSKYFQDKICILEEFDKLADKLKIQRQNALNHEIGVSLTLNDL